jgi:alkylated DNA repair dioxygenase AlkB
MPQLALFGSDDIIVTDDDRGRIVYTPHFVDAPTAQRWFEQLRREVSWRTERRMMYDREIDVPRLLGSYRLDPPAASVPAAILEARQRVMERLGVPFTAVGLNLYRDGRDSVAPHNDHLDEIREGFPIALVSLGARRRMTIREKQPRFGERSPHPERSRRAPHGATHVDLEAGSLFVMDYTTQLHYTHGVPKTTDPVGERISLAFRVKHPPRASDGGIYK